MTTEERLNELEKKLVQAKRRAWWLLLVAFMVSVTISGAEAALKFVVRHEASLPFGETIRANAFEVVDVNGAVRSVLRVVKNNPTLEFRDREGNRRSVLALEEDGAGLAFYDSSGTITGQFTSANNGDSMIFLSDRDGIKRAGLYNDVALGPGLNLTDAKGTVRAGLAITKDGPIFGLNDENLKSSSGLVVGPNGPRLYLNDGNDTIRFLARVSGDKASLQLNDESGKSSWHSP